MRILVVNSLYTPYIIGGAEISSQKLSEGLCAAGHEVLVLTTGNSDGEEIINGVRVIRRRFSNIMSFWDFKHGTVGKRVLYKLIDIYNLLNRRTIIEVINETKPDVIHANTIYGITPVVWECAEELGIPVVQTLRDYYLMCPKANLMRKNGEACGVHSNPVCDTFRCFHILKSRKVKAVTAPSHYTLSRFLEAGYFKDAKKQVVYNAIDFDTQKLLHMAELRLNKKSEEVHVIYIGSFIETKGIKFLLEAVDKTHDNVIFHFAGKGALQPEIKKKAQATKRVVLEGFLNERDLSSLLERMDLLVCPSVWAEPFGRVVIDAYKSYLPVVATNCGGLPELVEDGITGRIVKPCDSDAIAAGIMEVGGWLFTDDRKNAFDRKLQAFSIHTQVGQFVELYKSIIRG